MFKRKRLGDILLSVGVLTQEQLDVALRYHQENNIRLGRALVSLGYVSEDTI